jgi:NADPH2:quinone reductase
MTNLEDAVSKAVRVYENGGPEVMRWEAFDPGAPGPGQLLLRHTAVAVNYRDIHVRTGLHAVPLPTGLGIEGAGIVEAIGPDVAGFRVGDRVACAGGQDNAYAEQRIVPAWRTVKLPDAIDDRTAAAMMVRGMTARYLLFATYPVKKGDAILVHSAAGGVGLILCQWAAHLGATVIGTVGSEAKVAVARANGCAHPIMRGRDDFVAKVREITAGRGVDVVYDSVGRDTFEGSLRCLRPRGLLASFGEASGDPQPVPPRRLGQMGSLFLTHPSLPHYTATRGELEETAADLFRVVADGTVKIDVTRTYALQDAAQAQRDLESGRTTGSPVLIV